MGFEWRCKYQDCKEMIKDRPIGTKYCTMHAEIRKKEVSQLKNRKSYLKRRVLTTKMNCQVCGNKLPLKKSKYCSDTCNTEGLKAKRKHRDYCNKEIKRHEKAIALLREQRDLGII